MYTPSSFFSPLLLSHYLTPSFASLSLFFFLLFCLKLDKYLLSVLWVVSNEMWNKGFSTGIRAQGIKVYLKGRQRFPESYSPMTVTPKYTRSCPPTACLCTKSSISCLCYAPSMSPFSLALGTGKGSIAMLGLWLPYRTAQL